MIPIYSILSFFSLLFYGQAVYLELLRGGYEAFVIASYFTLMCHYIAPSLHEQKAYFRNLRPTPWVFPLKRVRTPRSGLTWFNILYVGIFQSVITRPFFATIAFATRRANRYCAYSSKPASGHLWIALVQGAFVLIAMYCLIQFHKQLKEDLAPHKPALKLLSIKLVMFVLFWQNWLLGLLASKGPFKKNRYLADVDIQIGIPCMLVCFEMIIVACLHYWAFPCTPYDIDHQLRGPDPPDFYACPSHQAILDALNPSDYARAAARGMRWLFHGVHHRRNDTSYQNRKLAAELDKDIEPERIAAASSTARTHARTDPDNGLLELKDRRKDRHTVG
jgi:hypothetical protein